MRRGDHFEDDFALQLDAVGGIVDDPGGEHRRSQETAHKAQHHPGLLAIGRDNHHRRLLTRPQMPRVIAEAGEIDAQQRHDERLARPPAAHEPSLVEWFDGDCRATGTLTPRSTLSLAHRQGEQCGEERQPGLPRRQIFERRPEQLSVLDRINNRKLVTHRPIP
jgi:hypothetical protein